MVSPQTKFLVINVKGHEQVRDLWKEYFIQADAIIFMVDSSDVDRLPEAKEVFFALCLDLIFKGTTFSAKD